MDRIYDYCVLNSFVMLNEITIQHWKLKTFPNAGYAKRRDNQAMSSNREH